eukprot:s577_g1.t1
MRLPKDESAGLVNNQQESWHFKLDKVLANASQEQVYDLCSGDVVRSVMDGYNGTVMAYGQTGAGKTHTMTGGHMGFADRGIVPRAISAIYAEDFRELDSHGRDAHIAAIVGIYDTYGADWTDLCAHVPELAA